MQNVKTKFVKDVEDELLDVFDENENLIDTILRSQTNTLKQKYTRSVIAIVCNSDDRLLVARRASHKEWKPNALSFVGGCIRSGETYEQALIREVDEEISLNINHCNYTWLGKFNPSKNSIGKIKAFFGIYKIELKPSAELVFNTDDFSEILWLRPSEVNKLIQDGENVCKNVSILIDKFFA